MSSNLEYLETRRKNIRKVILNLIYAIVGIDVILFVILIWSCNG